MPGDSSRNLVVSIEAARSRRHFPPVANRRRARDRYDISADDAARAAGVDVEHYAAWERGEATLPAVGFERLSELLCERARLKGFDS